MLQSEREGSVLRLTLSRPEVRNAFNDELISGLRQAFDTLPKDIRVVVLAGAGKSFSAGGDLEWMRKAAAYTDDENRRDALNLARLFKAISEAPAVVIARVQGAAFGGGCGLVCASDYAIAEDGAQFAFSEAKLGLVPATISPFVIPKIGAGNARALFSTGLAFDAGRALRIGLVHSVVPLERLDEEVEAVVSAVLKCGPHAAATSKRIAQSPTMSLDEAAAVLARARASEEGREGVAAFLEKRPASFVEQI